MDDLAQPAAKDPYTFSTEEKIVRGILRFLARDLFGLQAHGLENIKDMKGKPTVIVSNHMSLFDAPAIALSLPFKPAFAMDRTFMERGMRMPLVGWLMSKYEIIPIDEGSGAPIRRMTKMVKDNVPLVVFTEGALSRTGTLMSIYEGAAAIIDNGEATIQTAYVEGFEGLKGQLTRMPYYPKKLFPKLDVTFGPQRSLDIPEGLSNRERKALRIRRMERIMLELPLMAQHLKQPLLERLKAVAGIFGNGRVILKDPNTSGMTFGRLRAGCYVLGRKLDAIVRQNQADTHDEKIRGVGVLLPTSVPSILTFLGLPTYGHVPAMLGPTDGAARLASCMETARATTIITSQRLVKKLKIEKDIAALSEKYKIVYLEDVVASVTKFDKLRGFLQTRGLYPVPKGIDNPEDPITILFTSGSEGPPKGVVWNSRNILAQAEQLHSAFPFTIEDRVLNAGPVFHAMGLMGTLMPVLNGVETFLYPSPLDSQNIARLLELERSTITYGSDTFFQKLAMRATSMNMAAMRIFITGSEKLKSATYDLYLTKFGKRLEEAYGMTEAAPGIAANTPRAHKKGSVGRALPGMEAMLVEDPDIEGEKVLHVKGPNIMMGYIMPSNPGILVPPPDGWLDTGDIATIDGEDFIHIKGRAGMLRDRINIGGEKITRLSIQNLVEAASDEKDADHAIVTCGEEKFVLCTTDKALTTSCLIDFAKASGHRVLGIPRDIIYFEKKDFPRLPIGKTDFRTLSRLANERFGAKAPAAGRPVSAPLPDAPSIP